MRRSVVPAFVLAGAAVTMLVIWFSGANAEQPIQRVQVGVLECRRGAREPGTAAGTVIFLRPRPTHLSCPPHPPSGEGGCDEMIKKIHDAAQRRFPACQIAATGGALAADPIKGRAPIREGGEWDKTSEVPAVHGASRWWAHSKAVKPHFSKQYWRAPARSRAPAVSMPALRSATPAPRPATTR